MILRMIESLTKVIIIHPTQNPSSYLRAASMRSIDTILVGDCVVTVGVVAVGGSITGVGVILLGVADAINMASFRSMFDKVSMCVIG